MIDSSYQTGRFNIHYKLWRKEKKGKKESWKPYLKNMEFMVCAPLANVPEDISLSLRQAPNNVDGSCIIYKALEHYIFKARRYGGVLSISLISMEILFGTISHTSLSVSTAKPLDIERDGCSSSNHSWSAGLVSIAYNFIINSLFFTGKKTLRVDQSYNWIECEIKENLTKLFQIRTLSCPMKPSCKLYPCLKDW